MYVSIEEFESWKTQVIDLKESNERMEKVIQQMREDFRQLSSTQPSQRIGVEYSVDIPCSNEEGGEDTTGRRGQHIRWESNQAECIPHRRK